MEPVRQPVRPGTIDWDRQGEGGANGDLAGQVQATQPQLGQRIRILTGKGICFPQAPHLAQAKMPDQSFSLPGVCDRLRLRDGAQLDCCSNQRLFENCHREVQADILASLLASGKGAWPKLRTPG